ncbi:glycine zipper 2TM protein [Pseudoduganella lurida]|uniref:Glycine zipper 2TM protein n=1 Tax=Pseudoduganella lurida TaxID=1036180 RepID=A0A562RMR2_9BURK|nr:glycine zipper 2TM domain-containing protein [Pseudoduganella lurida]TWI70153.1 glycine zipper 2TM protein [Pseudoduganella lurida]
MNKSGITEKKKSVHSLFIIAAVVLILFCGVGIASLMGWLPSKDNAGRPENTLSPPTEQAATAAVAPPTSATQSSQYAAGAGTINGEPAKGLVASGSSVGGNGGSSGVIAAPVVPANDERVATRGRDESLARERERERERDRAAERKRAAAAVCNNCGIVESVDEVKTRASGSGLGAAGGAVVGGLLGRQVGGGHGRDLATIAGAVGGAVVGNQVEGNVRATRAYDVTVRMHDGEIRKFNTDSAVWRAGDQVKVVNDRLQSR